MDTIKYRGNMALVVSASKEGFKLFFRIGDHFIFAGEYKDIASAHTARRNIIKGLWVLVVDLEDGDLFIENAEGVVQQCVGGNNSDALEALIIETKEWSK